MPTTSASRLFNRGVSVTLSRPLDFKVLGGEVKLVTTITGLRVTFNIEKTLSEEPNTCELQIFNLAETTRGELDKKPMNVRIDAGYDGVLERLFQGDLRWGASKHVGVDWESKIQLGDGDRSYRYARVNRSFKAGVNIKTALGEVVKSMGLKMPKSAAEATDLIKQFASGTVVHGPSQVEMTRLLEPYGMSWSIQDGGLQILKGSDPKSQDALLVSQDTGMIGTPEFGPPMSKSGKDEKKLGSSKPILTVLSLLYPGVTPGGLIQMDARKIKGLFRVDRVVHSGDTHGPDWQTKIEARQHAA